MNGSDLIVVQGTGEWSALYDMSNGGRLLTHGDHYLIEDKIRSVLGIVTEHSNAFLDSTGKSAGVASTYHEFEKRRADEKARLAQADKLEEQARELNVEAAELRKQR